MPAIISQQLAIKDWPLSKVGDKKFFGYVVAMGMFPFDWCDDALVPYVDFAYNDAYERFRLPNDENLRRDLHDILFSNLEASGGIYGKVWIGRTPDGYYVTLP